MHISAKTGNYRPDLDMPNSSALFRNIFSIIDYSKIDENYSFQKDPTGDGNDRIFPIIDLFKTLCLTKRRKDYEFKGNIKKINKL